MRGIGDQVEESENTKGGMRLYMTHGRRGGGGGGHPSCDGQLSITWMWEGQEEQV